VSRSLLYKFAMLAGWMVVIFLLSNEPSTTSSERSGAIVEVVKTIGTSLPNDVLIFITRKLAHIIAYLILGFSMFLVVCAHTPNVRKAILVSILFVCLYAITDEFHQTFVPGRSGEVRDVLIDTAAGAAGVLVTYAIIRWRTLQTGVITGKKPRNNV
jgi:VanZ family protein